MVLNTLDLMIPLLERHFSPSRTESVNARGTHPLSGHEHAEEMTDICSGAGVEEGFLATVRACHISIPLPVWDQLPHHCAHLRHCFEVPLDFPGATLLGM